MISLIDYYMLSWNQQRSKLDIIIYSEALSTQNVRQETHMLALRVWSRFPVELSQAYQQENQCQLQQIAKRKPMSASTKRSTKCTTVCAAGNLHACFAIASRIIVGVLAKTNNQCQLQQSEHSLIDTRESPLSILSSEQKFWTSRETHILSFRMKLAKYSHTCQ